VTELARPRGQQGTDAGRSSAHQPLPRRTVLTGNVAQQLPPPRPAVTSDLAAPVGPAAPARPGTVRATVALWWAGAAAALTGLAAALLDSTALRERLTATATAADPTATPELVADGVRATVGLVLGGVALVVLVSLVWVELVRRRRSWARWALLVTAVPVLLALDVAQSIVTGASDVDRIALLVAGGLFVLALVPLLGRSARAWFRSPRR
jgi:hypothetical protein